MLQEQSLRGFRGGPMTREIDLTTQMRHATPSPVHDLVVGFRGGSADDSNMHPSHGRKGLAEVTLAIEELAARAPQSRGHVVWLKRLALPGIA